MLCRSSRLGRWRSRKVARRRAALGERRRQLADQLALAHEDVAAQGLGFRHAVMVRECFDQGVGSFERFVVIALRVSDVGDPVVDFRIQWMLLAAFLECFERI